MSSKPFSETYWLKERARMLNAGFFARIDEYAFDFPGDAPAALIDLLKELQAKLALRIEASSNEKLLATIIHLIKSLSANFLEILDNAHTEQTPRALVKLLEDLTRKVEPGAQLLLWPQIQHNFSVWRVIGWLRTATDTLLTDAEKQDVFGKVSGTLNVVSFPRIERDNIFMHPVFGHELGHPIADEFLRNERGDIKFAQRFALAKRELRKVFSGELGRQKNPVDRLNYEKKLVEAVVELRQRALQELISDVVGVQLFGPPALFAMYDNFIGKDLDDLPTATPEYYPPRRFRLRTMCDIVSDSGCERELRGLRQIPTARDAMEQFFEHMQSITRPKSDIAALNGHKLCSVAYGWVQETLVDAMKATAARLRDTGYDARRIEREIPELVQRLEVSLPPNEIGAYPNETTADWRSAVLGAWVHRIRRMRDVTEFGETFSREELEDIQGITMAAIEMVLLKQSHDAYLAQRGTT